MARTAQILFLLLVGVALQCHGGHHYYRGRSHGKYYSGHHWKHGEMSPQEIQHLKYLISSAHKNSNKHNSQPPYRTPSGSEERPLNGANEFKDPEVHPVPIGKSENLDDVAKVKVVDGVSKKPEESKHTDSEGNNIQLSPGNDGAGTIKVNGLSPAGLNDLPKSKDSINVNNGLSPVEDKSKRNVGTHLSGKEPSIHLGKPDSNIKVTGLEPGKIGAHLSNENHEKPNQSKIEKPSHDNNINTGAILSKDKLGNNDDTIHVNGLSPSEDNKINGISLGGDNDKGDVGNNIHVDGLSPGGDYIKPHENINVNGLSPGGDVVNDHGIQDDGRLPSTELGKPNHIDDNMAVPLPGNHDIHMPDISNVNNGHSPSDHGAIGAHVELPHLTGHNENGGEVPMPDLSGNIDEGFLMPKPGLPEHVGIDGQENKPELSGHVGIDNLVHKPDLSGQVGIGGILHKPDLSSSDHGWPGEHQTFPGNDILTNPNQDIIEPNNKPAIVIPGQVDNQEEIKKNNSMLIPVILPGGGIGHIYVQPSVLNHMPSYIIAIINGHPTLIQNPGLGIGGGTTLPINGGSWIHINGIGGEAGGIGSIGVIPNIQRPIVIGSQFPNYQGGVTGGDYIIPDSEPVEPVPVPVPVPRPIPVPRPVLPEPEPIPIPEPVAPSYINVPSVQYPAAPWPFPWTMNPSNPSTNFNLTHLFQNSGSNLDWKRLFNILLKISSRLPKQQQPQPPTQSQVKQPSNPRPSYPSYPYPPYPYPYPPTSYPYPPYTFPPYVNPGGTKAPGSGKSVIDHFAHDKDIATQPDNDEPTKEQPIPDQRPNKPDFNGQKPEEHPRPNKVHPKLVDEPKISEEHSKLEVHPRPSEEHHIPNAEHPRPVEHPRPSEEHHIPNAEHPRPSEEHHIPNAEHPRPVEHPRPSEEHHIPNTEHPRPVEHPRPSEEHHIPNAEHPRPVEHPRPSEEHHIPNTEHPRPVEHPRPSEEHHIPNAEHPRPVEHPRPSEEHHIPNAEHPRPVEHPRPSEEHHIPNAEHPRPVEHPRPSEEHHIPNTEHPRPVEHPRPSEEHPRPQEPHARPGEKHPRPDKDFTGLGGEHSESFEENSDTDEEHPRPGKEYQRPGKEYPRPDGERPRPGGEYSRPSAEHPRPVEHPKPSEDHPRPGKGYPGSGEERPRPTEDHLRPSEERPRPGGEHLKPGENRPRPGDVHSGSEEEHKEPSEGHKTPMVPEYNREPKEERPKHDHKRPAHPDVSRIDITLPTLNHGKPGSNHGLLDILNVLLKFPNRHSNTNTIPKDLGPLIKLLLTILKPGDKNLHEHIEDNQDVGALAQLLLHVLNSNKEPNMNVLVEPGMDAGTRSNLLLLLTLLANDLAGSYSGMGYYQAENPLVYFLGHLPCDHPNISAISGLQSNSNLWQLLANMYGHNLGQTEVSPETGLEQLAEETEKPVVRVA